MKIKRHENKYLLFDFDNIWKKKKRGNLGFQVVQYEISWNHRPSLFLIRDYGLLVQKKNYASMILIEVQLAVRIFIILSWKISQDYLSYIRWTVCGTFQHEL